MRSNLQRITIVSFLGILIVGCATPQHTNTLIFGTNTKLALDISQSPTNLPSITFGYKREEAVWMPLLANRDKNGNTCNSPTTKSGAETGKPAIQADNDNSPANFNCLYQGTDGEDEDTYSVLASFGSKFNGESNAINSGQTKAGGGLAQFFATGIAARKLAANQAATKLFSVQPNQELSREDVQEILNSIENENAQIDAIIEHISPSGVFSNGELIKLVESSNIEQSTKIALKKRKMKLVLGKV